MAREPGQAGELHGIQMLRGIAALAVLAHHALEESNGAAGRFSPVWLTTLGAAGVDLFFVISGFIMLHVSFRPDRPPERALPFLQRRATRIYPLYWLCCGAMLLLIAMGFLKGQRLDAADIATSLLLVPGHRLVIGVAWTLVFEIGFYLVFAALLPLASATRVVAGATMLFAMLLALASSLPAGPMRAFAANPLTLEFCLGLWLAWAFGRGMRRGGWAPAGLGVGLLIAATVLVPHDSTAGLEGWPRLLGWGLPAALIVAALMARGKPRGVAGRALVALGDASYALYLTHAFVMIAYAWLIKHRGLGAIDQRPIVILVVILAVAIGVATHRLIERPLLGLLRRGRPLLPAAPQDGGAPPTSAALARSPAGAPPPRQGG